MSHGHFVVRDLVGHGGLKWRREGMATKERRERERVSGRCDVSMESSECRVHGAGIGDRLSRPFGARELVRAGNPALKLPG